MVIADEVTQPILILQPWLHRSCLDLDWVVGRSKEPHPWAARPMPLSGSSCSGGDGWHSTLAVRSESRETSGDWQPRNDHFLSLIFFLVWLAPFGCLYYFHSFLPSSGLIHLVFFGKPGNQTHVQGPWLRLWVHDVHG